MTLTRSLLVTLTAVASVTANIFVTSPLSATVWQANDNSAITWQDSGSPPVNTAIGAVQIFLAVGAATAQQKLVQLGQADANDGTFAVPWPLITSMEIGDSSCFGVQFIPVNPASGAGMSFSPQFTISGLTNQFNASIASVVSSLAPQCIGNAAAITSLPASSSAVPSSTVMSSSLPATATKNASTPSTSTTLPKSTSVANGTKSAAMSLYPIHVAGLDIVLLLSVASLLAVAI